MIYNNNNYDSNNNNDKDNNNDQDNNNKLYRDRGLIEISDDELV